MHCLVEQYKHGHSLYFSSPEQTLLATPPCSPVILAEDDNLPLKIRESLNLCANLGFKEPIVMGAIDLTGRDHSAIRVCPYVQSAPTRWQAGETGHKNRSRWKETAVCNPVPGQAKFRRTINMAKKRFADGELEKVVLSRSLEIKTNNPIQSDQVLKRLQQNHRRGYTFAFNLPFTQEPGKTRTLIGATPELLVRKEGRKIIVNPLAGSIPRHSDPTEDKAVSENLLRSPKDLFEHKVVVDSIQCALAPICASLSVPPLPELLQTPTLWHLSTVIVGELNEDLTSLEVAQVMHPTPAICGAPRQKAQDFIQQHEGYDRGLFTGLVGWQNLKGDGEWAVTIRCAEFIDNQITLYAGAGIVNDSCPEKEFRETAAKFGPMLDALELPREWGLLP